VIVQLALAVVAGLSLGVGFSTLANGFWFAVALLTGLAVIGEWLEVRLGPIGTITLRPAIALTAMWIGSVGLLLFVGLVPVVLVNALERRASLSRTVITVGRDALAFWASYGVYLAARQGLGGLIGFHPYRELTARVAGALGFWLVQIPTQAVELQLTEGVRFSAILQHLGRRALPHVLALTGLSVALGHFQQTFGLIVAGFASVMAVEVYYPWKLIGQQRGVLLTSLQMMAQAVDLKDPYTSNHSQRVAEYAARIARAMGLPEEEVERIRIGGLMHDIGKIGISGRIIRKPGKLTTAEMDLMKQHASLSASIIEPLEILGESALMVRHHHERWDGTGYPDGLKGNEIPTGSRIIFAADALDALMTDRPYRRGASKAEALRILRENSGTQFDPAVVSAVEQVFRTL